MPLNFIKNRKDHLNPLNTKVLIHPRAVFYVMPEGRKGLSFRIKKGR
jgi:hypothetical protein